MRAGDFSGLWQPDAMDIALMISEGKYSPPSRTRMREITGDIWDYHNQGHWIVITTNGAVRKDGACVMGRGVAKQATQKFPYLAHELGKWIKKAGNALHIMPEYKIITFPVKHNWWEKASLELIEYSCASLVACADFHGLQAVYMVRPGCGNGQLHWENEVRPLLEKCLDGRFIVVEREER